MCDHDKALYKSTFTLPYITQRPGGKASVEYRPRGGGSALLRVRIAEAPEAEPAGNIQ